MVRNNIYGCVVLVLVKLFNTHSIYKFYLFRHQITFSKEIFICVCVCVVLTLTHFKCL